MIYYLQMGFTQLFSKVLAEEVWKIVDPSLLPTNEYKYSNTQRLFMKMETNYAKRNAEKIMRNGKQILNNEKMPYSAVCEERNLQLEIQVDKQYLGQNENQATRKYEGMVSP